MPGDPPISQVKRHRGQNFASIRVEAFLDKCDAIGANYLVIHTMRHLTAAHITPKSVNGWLTGKPHGRTRRAVTVNDDHFGVIGIEACENVGVAPLQRMA